VFQFFQLGYFILQQPYSVSFYLNLTALHSTYHFYNVSFFSDSFSVSIHYFLTEFHSTTAVQGGILLTLYNVLFFHDQHLSIVTLYLETGIDQVSINAVGRSALQGDRSSP
jgi:hypothetical protein